MSDAATADALPARQGPQGPLSGVRVLDLSAYIAGPYGCSLLADQGAQVIKIEPPEGDPFRELYRGPGSPPSERNYFWELEGRNKRSLVLDLKQPEAHAALCRLVAQADVFITNLPLPVRRRLRIGHTDLAPLNPRLIYASFTAYGERGAEADKTGFDSTAYWARSGLMDIVRPDHTAPPARSVTGMGDHPSSTALFAAIATALFRRERTGKGGLVRSSLIANGLWANSSLVQAELSGTQLPPRQPREQAPNALTNLYRCGDDRWLNLVVLNERQFKPLVQALGCPEVADDPRFAQVAERRQHQAALVAIFDAQFARQPLAHWRRALDAAQVTFGVVGTLADVPGDEQMRDAGAIVPFADGSGLTVSSPFEIDGVTKRAPGRAPALGEHSAQVLREAGFDDAQIARLTTPAR